MGYGASNSVSNNTKAQKSLEQQAILINKILNGEQVVSILSESRIS